MLSRFMNFNKRSFNNLSQQEILALAISNEEDDGRIYQSFAENLREDYPDTANMFVEMAEEENEHRRWLIDLHREKYGEIIPLVRREHIRGFFNAKGFYQPFGFAIEKPPYMFAADQGDNFAVFFPV